MDTKEAGRRGGLSHAKRRLAGQAERAATGGVGALSLKEIESRLPKLDSVKHAKRRLEIVGNWAAAGLLSGSAAGACVRSVEVWLKLHDSELDREHIKALEERIKELEAELAKRPAALRKVL